MLKLGDTLWRLLDPALLRLESRLAHLRRTYPQTHNRNQWITAATFGESTQFLEGARIANYAEQANLCIGEHTHVAGELSIIAPGGTLHIGKCCFIGQGSRIWAQQSIVIGDHVLIAHLVDVHDSNAHSTNVSSRRADPVNLFRLGNPVDWRHVKSRPVVIEDDVWLGLKSTVLKGVTVGRGAIVAAGAVVTKDVPPYTLVAGNPARFVRKLDREQE